MRQRKIPHNPNKINWPGREFKEKYFFVHVPRSGGTNLSKMFLSSEVSFCHYDGRNIVSSSDKFELIFGHIPWHVYDDRTRITIMRNPIDRVVSHYYYTLQKNENTKGKFKSIFFPTREGNFITLPKNISLLEFAGLTRNLSSRYMGRLDNFKFVGIFECLELSINQLSRILNTNLNYIQTKIRASKRPKYDDIDKKVLYRIKDLNEEDCNMYYNACNMRIGWE